MMLERQESGDKYNKRLYHRSGKIICKTNHFSSDSSRQSLGMAREKDNKRSGKFRDLLFTFMICLLLLLSACGQKNVQSGLKGSFKPSTIKGKTYYPLKSAHGFMEEGIASWYGPGFHGKKTASGETFNQYAMTAAHKTLPLGTRVRVTRLDNGRSVLVKINDRGPFAEDRIIDLSRAAASRLEITGKGTGRVRVQSLGGLPEVDSKGDISGKFYIQLGAFGQKENAQKLVRRLSGEGRKGRLIFGNNNMWNVQAGPWQDSASAQKMLESFKAVFPAAFVVGDK